MPATSRFLAHLAALATAVIFGLTFLSTRSLYEFGFGPFTVLVWRMLLAWGLLIFLSPKILWTGSVVTELKTAFLGVMLALGWFGLQNLALWKAQASSVSIAMTCAPLMTAILALVVLKGVHMHWLAFLGICSAATGLFLVWFDLSAMNDLTTKGLWIGLLASMGWAFYSMMMRTVTDLSAALLARKATGYGLLAALPFFLMEPSTPVSTLTEPLVIANILFLGLVATSGATVLWHYAVKRIGSGSADPWLYLIPLVTITGGVCWFDEKISFVGVMGALVILCGVAISQRALAKLAYDLAKQS